MSRGALLDAGVFVGAGALLFAVVQIGVPALRARGLDPFAAWMILSILCVWIPIIVAGMLVLRSEGASSWSVARLRLGRPSRADLAWTAGGVVAIAIGSAAMHALGAALGTDPDPFDRSPQAWSGGRAWMFALWIVYWPFNILGEELTWRAVLLPRMEARLGHHAWLANAALWCAFHVGFGLGNIIVLMPTLLVTPLLAQRRKNTWVAVALHAGLSLPAMMAIAAGKV